MIELPVRELTAEAFAPFGRVIEQPERSPDATGPGWQWWGETTLLEGDDRPFGIGYLDLQPAHLSFDWAERHMRSRELIVPVGGDCLVYVGPPERPEEPDALPSLESFQVFRVHRGQGVLLEKAVWHGAPLSIAEPLRVVVLLHQGTGSSDVYAVRFADTPVQIQK